MRNASPWRKEPPSPQSRTRSWESTCSNRRPFLPALGFWASLHTGLLGKLIPVTCSAQQAFRGPCPGPAAATPQAWVLFPWSELEVLGCVGACRGAHSTARRPHVSRLQVPLSPKGRSLRAPRSIGQRLRWGQDTSGRLSPSPRCSRSRALKSRPGGPLLQALQGAGGRGPAAGRVSRGPTGHQPQSVLL